MGLLRVALTGGIATGKSHVLARFAALGVPTIDADRIARAVVERGQPAHEEIRDRFGEAFLDGTGGVDRARLARHVFDDAPARAALEAIVHPRVRAAIDAWFRRLAADPGATFAVADIPLLYETGRAREFDRVIVAVCPPPLQLQRLMARDALPVADARKRIAAQLPTSDKAARADFVIHTDRTVEDTDRQVGDVRDALDRLARGETETGRG